jgi:hypothetical protein
MINFQGRYRWSGQLRQSSLQFSILTNHGSVSVKVFLISVAFAIVTATVAGEVLVEFAKVSSEQAFSSSTSRP